MAESEGGVAGFCVVDWKLESGRRVGHFITIDVAPEQRRRGLGSRLIAAGETLLAEMGSTALTLEVATGNEGARSFYHRHGYEQTGRIPGYYADGVDALVLRKEVPPAG